MEASAETSEPGDAASREDVLGVGRDEEQGAPVVERPGPETVDEERLAELERKRGDQGLTDDEANELGRLIAAKEGRPYSNAQVREHPDSVPSPESAPTLGDEEPDVAGGRPAPGERKPREDEARDLAR
jgi:hypothetical protein